MLEQIKNLPPSVVGFRATGEVTKDDYDGILKPAVDDLVARMDEIRFLLAEG